MGLIIGFVAIRRQGIYFAMITLALSQMFAFICLQVPFTHGEDGIQGVPRGYLLGLIDLNQPLAMYYVTLAIFLFGFFAIWRIVNSPFGNILKASVRTRSGPSRLATGSTGTSSAPSSCRRGWRALPAARRPSCSSSRPSPTCSGRCRAR
jgi:hypothetical protein